MRNKARTMGGSRNEGLGEEVMKDERKKERTVGGRRQEEWEE